MIGDRLLRVAHHAFVMCSWWSQRRSRCRHRRWWIHNTSNYSHPLPITARPRPDGTAMVQGSCLTLFLLDARRWRSTPSISASRPPAPGIVRVDFLPLRHTVPDSGRHLRGTRRGDRSWRLDRQHTCRTGSRSKARVRRRSARRGSRSAPGTFDRKRWRGGGHGCAWTAISNNTSWLTVTGGASGSGNGTVTFQRIVESEPGSARTGTRDLPLPARRSR